MKRLMDSYVEVFQMTDQSLRTGLQRLLTATAVVALAGCTITPWGASPASNNGTAGSYSTGVPVEPGYYRVNPGDTLPAIAAAFGQRPQDVARWNGLQPNASVTVGQVLRVAPPPASMQAPSAATAAAPQPQSGAAASAAAAPVPGMLKWPLQGPILNTFKPGVTKGIVIGGWVGEPVTAAAAGRVVYAGDGIESYGPLIIIKHSDSLITAYGQNSTIFVKEGDVVTQGQTIGEVGTDSRGVASIQFEVRQNGQPVDPLAWLPKQGS
jgi:lipoprotein NlpD